MYCCCWGLLTLDVLNHLSIAGGRRRGRFCCREWHDSHRGQIGSRYQPIPTKLCYLEGALVRIILGNGNGDVGEGLGWNPRAAAE